MGWRGLVQAALCGLLLAGCAVPRFRGEQSFPRDKIFRRIKCELFRAVVIVDGYQQGVYADTKVQFPLEKYIAELTLGQRSRLDTDAEADGSVFSRDRSRSLAGGSNRLPGTSFETSNLVASNGSRAIYFSDILADSQKPAAAPGETDTSFYRSCDAAPVGPLPIGQDLGILDRLTDTLKELKTSPGIVTLEEYNFDFSVGVSVGGTVSFFRPFDTTGFGAGAGQTLNETLRIRITLLP